MSSKDDSTTILDAASEFETKYKETIAEKMKQGLTHDQAVSATKAQVRHDAASAKAGTSKEK